MAKAKKESSTLDVFDEVNKKFGAGAIVRMDEVPDEQYDVVPSGSIRLDRALGIGGYACGRIVELYGSESSGKTTLALHAIANAQKLGMRAAFVDAEHALDVKYAAALGVDVTAMAISQPDYGEQALEITDMLVKSGQVGVVVVDSVAALTPKAELDGEMGQQFMGLQARMMGQALRKLVAAADANNVLLMFINQTRMKIGVVYGSPVTTPGGAALKFAAAIRLEVARAAKVKDASDVVTANRTRVKVQKNKLAPPFTEAEFDIEFGVGICRSGELIEEAVACGKVVKSGSWLTFGEHRWQGLQNAKAALSADEELMAAVAAQITGEKPCK